MISSLEVLPYRLNVQYGRAAKKQIVELHELNIKQLID